MERMSKRAHPISFLYANPTGVLSDREILLLDEAQGKRALRSIFGPPDLGELHALLAFLWETGVGSLWIMPGTPLSQSATCACFEQARQHWVVVTHADSSEQARPTGVFLWPKESRQQEARRLSLLFPEHAGWPWVLPDATSLLATVTYLEQALARPVLDSPALFAHQMLSDLTRDRPPSWSHSPPESLHALLGKEEIMRSMREAGRALSWARPLTLGELRQRYLHKYTHLSRDLEACLTARLGGGTLEYSPNGRAYDALRPGTWRIHIERAGSIFDMKHLPDCLESEWVSTPQVKCCQDIGYRVDVLEGYCWSQAHNLLTPWAETLWRAAARLSLPPRSPRHGQGRANGVQTIKDLAERGIALLAQDKSQGGWNRPDWWATIAGGSRALLFSHLARLAKQGVMPVLIERDALWVVADDPNPLTAVPGLVSVHHWKGYRVGYEVPLALSREVKAAFTTLDQPEHIARALDTLAEEVPQGKRVF